MLTSADDVSRWLKLQGETVIMVSAFLAPVKFYLDRCESDVAYADDMSAVYQLHTIVQDWDEGHLLRNLQQLNLQPYYHPIRDPRHMLEINTTGQTIPSRTRAGRDFVELIEASVAAMSEAVLALAKVPPPAFSVTLAAGTPFDAYLLISRLLEGASEYVYIADAYLDVSLFDRYLFRVKDDVQVSIRTNPPAWNRKGWKEQFEQAEVLFRAQHAKYERKDASNLHARYLITDTGAWRIDGSIKDAAVSKDCPMHTITPEERERVIGELFS